jgi:hypothetical protein
MSSERQSWASNDIFNKLLSPTASPCHGDAGRSLLPLAVLSETSGTKDVMLQGWEKSSAKLPMAL